MSQVNISEYLDPYRSPRMAFGLKANSTLNRITQTPSNANPGETLYIEIPKIIRKYGHSSWECVSSF